MELDNSFLQSSQGVVRKDQSSRKITRYFSEYHILYLQKQNKTEIKIDKDQAKLKVTESIRETLLSLSLVTTE